MRPLVTYSLLALLCLSFVSGFSQEFKDGFIIDADQNFVYGYIAFSETPNETCLFKEQKNGSATTYTPGQIQGYGVINGNHYRKRQVENVDGNQYPQDVFLEAVVDGPVVLYVGFNRMFVERGESFYEIKREREKEKQETYRKTLSSLMGDCPNVAKKTKQVAIDVSTMKALVQEYNNCSPDGKQSTTRHVTVRAIGIMVGLDRSRLTLEGSGAAGLENKLFTDRTLANTGIHYQLSPKWSRHFALVSGLWFNDQRLYMSSPAGTARVETIRINYRLLRVPLMLAVGNFSNTKANPYLKAGFSIPFMLKHNASLSQETQRGNEVYIDNFQIAKKFKEPALLHIAAGLSYAVHPRVNSFLEFAYSHGKNDFELETSKRTAESNFNIIGINIGLARSF